MVDTTDTKKVWTIASDFKNVIPLLIRVGQSFDNRFMIDDRNRSLFDLLFWYFSNKYHDMRIGNTADANKGICLMGPRGTGKSLAFEIMQHIFGGFKIALATDVPFEFLKDQDMKKYKEIRFESGIQTWINTWCFDDLGLEEPINREMKINLIADILTTRYANQKKYGIYTHATTNMNREGLNKFYGERLADRFNEMFTFIPVEGISYRESELSGQPGKPCNIKFKIFKESDDKPMTDEQKQEREIGLEMLKDTLKGKKQVLDNFDLEAAVEREKRIMNGPKKIDYKPIEVSERAKKIQDYQDAQRRDKNGQPEPGDDQILEMSMKEYCG